MTTTQDDKKEQAKQAASTAADEGRHVAGVASEEARGVAGEATQHVKGLLNETVSQVGEQSKSQRDTAVATLRGLTDDLQKMASSEGGSGLAGELASQVADRTERLGKHLDGREPADLLDDVRSFARKRPGVFLVGALVAGVAVGRLARGAKAAQGDSTTDSPSPATTAPSVADVSRSSYSDPVSSPIAPATTAYPAAPAPGGGSSAPETGTGGFHA